MKSLIWISEIGVQMKGLLLIKCIENSMEREQCVLEVLMSDVFDIFFRMARVRMCLHTLVFVCLWFAFCKRSDMKWKGKMETGKLEACVIKVRVIMP